jgi:hypothetical protein
VSVPYLSISAELVDKPRVPHLFSVTHTVLVWRIGYSSNAYERERERESERERERERERVHVRVHTHSSHECTRTKLDDSRTRTRHQLVDKNQ